MRNLILSFILLLLYSCSPYEQYAHSHYYIQAELDPLTSRLTANVQLVFIAGQKYQDSICFTLNSGLEILAFSAQELKYYTFQEYEAGKLVIYIEDPLMPGSQLQISMSYSGRIARNKVMQLDSSLLWLPYNNDIRPFTCQAKISLPADWQIIYPKASRGEHGKWHVELNEPINSLTIHLAPD